MPSDEDKCGCTEAGFCGNLAPLDSGKPHPNCNAWAKDCKCSCRQHWPRPGRKIIDLPALLGPGQAKKPWKLRGEPATETAVSGGKLRTVGTLSYADVPYWDGAADELVGAGGALPPNRDAPTNDQRVGLVALQNGHLGKYINYFLATCAAQGPDIHFFIMHTEDESGRVDPAMVPPNVHMLRVTLAEVAEKILALLGDDCEQHSAAKLMTVLDEPSSTNFGSKFNDLKMLFGSIFKKELAGYGYWGWYDLDCFMGDLKGAVKQYVPEFDVITFPDGGLAAAYAAGQVTIFRNIEYFRTCFTKKTRWINMVCEPGNRLWDEKFTMAHAMRSKQVRLAVDMSVQFSGSAVAMATEFQWYNGHVLRRSDGATTTKFDSNEKMIMGQLKKMRTTHTCIGYWQNYAWKCLSGMDGSTHGLIFTWRDMTMTVKYRPPAVYKDADGKQLTEHGAFIHLHTWKGAKTWKFQKDGYYGKRFIFKTEGGEPKSAILTVFGQMK